MSHPKTNAERGRKDVDAARYRWLRDRKHIDIAACWILPAGAEMAEQFSGAELDAAIDAAMAAEDKS